MKHLPKSLHDMFPSDTELLRHLKEHDGHFQALVADLEAADQAVAAIDSGGDPASNVRAEDTRKQRLKILDDIATVVSVHRLSFRGRQAM